MLCSLRVKPLQGVVARHALVPGEGLPGQHRVVSLRGAGQVVLDQPGQLLKEGEKDSEDEKRTIKLTAHA